MFNLKKIKPNRKYITVVLIFASLSQTACFREPQKRPFKLLTGSQGCVIEQLTSEAYNEFQHQGVSYDGQWLSVGWNNGEDTDGNPIRGSYILNLATGEKKQLAAPINHNSSFSPDGSLLIGAHYTADGKSEIFEYDLNRNQATVIAPDLDWDFKPSYSPDGDAIVFNSYRSGNSEIYIYHRFEKGLKQLTDHESYDAHGEYSPDGSKILFHRQVKKFGDGLYDFDLYSYDLTSGVETRLTSTPLEESYGSWAPDGKKLVFSFNNDGEPGHNSLYVMDSDGRLTQLTGGDWKDSYAYWMRDGSYIYFNSDRSGVTEIYRIEMEGSTCTKAN